MIILKKIKTSSVIIIILNILALICLVYFAVPFIVHDTTVNNPDAMLPMESWDGAGFCLTIGFFPLLIANALAYKFLGVRKSLRLIFFLPSLVCAVIVISYLAVSFTA